MQKPVLKKCLRMHVIMWAICWNWRVFDHKTIFSPKRLLLDTSNNSTILMKKTVRSKIVTNKWYLSSGVEIRGEQKNSTNPGKMSKSYCCAKNYYPTIKKTKKAADIRCLYTFFVNEFPLYTYSARFCYIIPLNRGKFAL